jgi:hypothetical protein
MDDRLRLIAAVAASQHGAVSAAQISAHDVSTSLRSKWERTGLIERLGPRSFAVVGSTPTFERALTSGRFDLEPSGVVAGRAGARLHGLDGFALSDAEFLVPRADRHRTTTGLVCASGRPLGGDTLMVAGFRCLTVERLILESPLFGFCRAETENAIDSAIRRRLTTEQRLRDRVARDHRPGVNGSRVLLDALVDAGGESSLERSFLRLVRQAGIARPLLQKTFRSDGRTVARVDAFFAGDVVVEVSGHGTHATRRQRQVDAQRHTELTLRGLRVITFTYEDIRHRPGWVIARIREALAIAA